MYNNENEFVVALVKELRKRGAFVQRLESHGTGVGIPDIWFAWHGMQVFIECKHRKALAKDPSKMLGKGQQAWHINYTKAMGRGNHIWILTATDKGIYCMVTDVMEGGIGIRVHEAPFEKVSEAIHFMLNCYVSSEGGKDD